jgi:hypothetical protein
MEDRGLTHWMLFSDGEAIYAYSIIHSKGVATKVLSNLKGVSSIAVDANLGYLFIATNDSETESYVYRYDFGVDISKTIPVLSVN